MNDEELTVYAAVATRSQQQDAMMWEVPVLGFTAQAFLFAIALGPSSTPLARTLTAVIAAGISFLCVTLMKRHRQLITHDQKWLEKREKALRDHDFRVNNRKWWKASLKEPVKARWPAGWVPTLRAYNAWIIGLSLIGAVALAIIPLAWAAPALLGR